MRRYMRKLKQSSQIACIGFMAMGLQACASGPKLAMDYLPETAMVLIDKDIQNGQQVDDQKENAISVRSMLASVLGLGDKADEAEIPQPQKEPITQIAMTARSLLAHTPPTPPVKPLLAAHSEQVLDVIDFMIDEQVMANVMRQASEHETQKAVAEISVGPVGKADSAQMASLQAMVKANAIGSALRGSFKAVRIKFNPLQPFGTVKITIKGDKRDA